MSFKFRPSDIGRYLTLECDKYLWLSINNKSFELANDSSIDEANLQYLFDKGDEYEYRTIKNSMKELFLDYKKSYNLDGGSFKGVPWNKCLKNISNSHDFILVQPILSIDKEMLRKIGIEFDTNIVHKIIPDLVIYIKNTNNLHIIDLKYSELSSLSHRIQVTFYCLVLMELDEIKNLNSNIIPSIWLDNNTFPGEIFKLDAYIYFIRAFLRNKISEIVNTDYSNLNWIMGPKCNKCKFQSVCKYEEEENPSIRSISYLNSEDINILTNLNQIYLNKINLDNILVPITDISVKKIRSAIKKEIDYFGEQIYLPESNIIILTSFYHPIKKKIIGIGALEIVENKKDFSFKILVNNSDSLHNAFINWMKSWSELKSKTIMIYDFEDISYINYVINNIFTLDNQLLNIKLDEVIEIVNLLNSFIIEPYSLNTIVLQEILRNHFSIPIKIDYDLLKVSEYFGFSTNRDYLEKQKFSDLDLIINNLNDSNIKKVELILKTRLESINCIYSKLINHRDFPIIKYLPKIELENYPIAINSGNIFWSIFSFEYLSSLIQILKDKMKLQLPLESKESEDKILSDLIFFDNNRREEYFIVEEINDLLEIESSYHIISKEKFLGLYNNNPPVDKFFLKRINFDNIYGGYLLTFFAMDQNYISNFEEFKNYSLLKTPYLGNFEKINRMSNFFLSNNDISSKVDFLSSEITTFQFEQELWNEIIDFLNSLEEISINKNQVKAIFRSFKNPISLVQGPPGTGKSSVAKWIALGKIWNYFNSNTNNNFNILIVGYTNKVINDLLIKIVENLKFFHQKKDLVDVIKIENDFKNSSNIFRSTKRPDVIKNFLNKSNHVTVIGSTIYQLIDYYTNSNDEINNKSDFDLVIIDEASQIPPSYGIFTISLFRKNSSMVLLGDEKQLRPVYSIKPKFFGRLSFYSYMFNKNQPEIMLDTNYRMNETITSFPSKMFYEGNLKSFYSKMELNEDCNCAPETKAHSILHKGSIVFINFDKISSTDTIGENIIIYILELCLQHFGMDFNNIKLLKGQLGVITSYKRTVHNIKKIFKGIHKDVFEINHLDEIISTVDSFQGQERQIILFFLDTDKNGKWRYDFILNQERFNVSMTRAKTNLIVIFGSSIFNSPPSNIEACESLYIFNTFYNLGSDKKQMEIDFNSNKIKFEISWIK